MPHRLSHLAVLILTGLLAACHATWLPVTGFTPPAEEPLGPTVALMSFNVRYGTARDGANSWDSRRDLVFERIHAAAPDVVGVQEALAFQLDQLVAALPGYVAFGVGRDDGARGGEFSAILYDAARFERANGGTFWLAPDPNAVGAVAWGASLPRICTWVELRERGTGAALFVFNTHWDHQSQESRARAGVLIRERMAALTGGERAVLMGDLNADEDNPALVRLRGDDPTRPPLSGGDMQLVDTLRAVHGDGPLPGTYSGFEDGPPQRRIDFVLTTPDLEIVDASVDLFRDRGRWPSDHCPVRATIALPD